MTTEQRNAKLSEIHEQLLVLKNEEKKLSKENQITFQQEHLRWVGRAFVGQDAIYLITSVPPILYTLHEDIFNEYQFPCIEIPNTISKPPIFNSVVFINEVIDEEMKEIPFAEFQSLLYERIDYLLKKAATAKMRQTGKEVFSIGRHGEICEK